MADQTTAGTPVAASSRIIIKNLPATRFTEAELRKHISQFRQVTDCRFFQDRRIAFVGFKTSSDAEKAVKHFNRTYIRTSKLEVDIARTVKVQNAIRSKDAVYQSIREDDNIMETSNKLKRKRGETAVEKDSTEPLSDNHPKLKEYLQIMQPSSKSKTWANELPMIDEPQVVEIPAGEESDEEYTQLPQKPKKTKIQEISSANGVPSNLSTTSIQTETHSIPEPVSAQSEPLEAKSNDAVAVDVSDSDWLRSRTSRTLDLGVEDDLNMPDIDATSTRPIEAATILHEDDDETMRSEHEVEVHETVPEVEHDAAIETVTRTGRLFLRNLYYSVTEDDIRQLLQPYGTLAEVHVPMDYKTSRTKGFAYVLFKDSSDAVRAFQELDQSIFQGRTLHVLPGEEKREQKLDDFAISKLPLKKQREILKRRAAAKSDFEWNSLYMNIDAVMASMANRLGIDKATLLDPTSSDASVRQAHAETHVIQETKKYFEQHGVDLSSFSQKERGNRTILIKNFPFGTKLEELRSMLSQYGELKAVLMPPAGIIAIADFVDDAGGRAAFGGLYGRKFKDAVLKIEKGPKGLFSKKPDTTKKLQGVHELDLAQSKISASDLKEINVESTAANTTSLFVKNLNFATTTDDLKTLFKPLEGFVLARVNTKSDPKKAGQTLSMGYGFVEFQTKAQAVQALQAMNGHVLDGHKLDIKASHKGEDAAAERRNEEAAKRESSKKTKIIIKNLAFEVTEKQVRQLFGQYGKLRSVRLPKKFNRSTRGFGFAEFVSIREAENAMEALRHTHLYGRPLVLEWAQGEAKNSEEEIQRLVDKVGKQVDSVKIAQLSGAAGRKKFDIVGSTAEEEF